MGGTGGTLSYPEDVNALNRFKRTLDYCRKQKVEEFLPLFTSMSRDPKRYFIRNGVMGAVYDACYNGSSSNESEFLDREHYRAQRFIGRISRE